MGFSGQAIAIEIQADSMAEQKMNDAVAKMVDNLDRSLLRDLQVGHGFPFTATVTFLTLGILCELLQKGGYLCSVKCIDNKNLSSEQLQNCVERCQMPMQQVQQYLQQEMQSFQVLKCDSVSECSVR